MKPFVNSTHVFGGSGGLGQELRKLYVGAEWLSSRDVDITSFKAVERYFEGKEVSTVINMTGYNSDGFLHDQDPKEYEKIVNVNVIGTLNVLRGCLPIMRKQKYGRIILISSVLATNPQLGASVYGATKNFIDGITKATALENAREHVTCNSIRLGYFNAGMTHQIQNWETIKYSVPMRRLGKVEELMEAIRFIERTEYLTGACLDINGGVS